MCVLSKQSMYMLWYLNPKHLLYLQPSSQTLLSCPYIFGWVSSICEASASLFSGIRAASLWLQPGQWQPDPLPGGGACLQAWGCSSDRQQRGPQLVAGEQPCSVSTGHISSTPSLYIYILDIGFIHSVYNQFIYVSTSLHYSEPIETKCHSFFTVKWKWMTIKMTITTTTTCFFLEGYRRGQRSWKDACVCVCVLMLPC